MDKLFDCWQSLSPIFSHLKPFDISRLSFTNKKMLEYIQQYFKRVKMKNTHQLGFLFNRDEEAIIIRKNKLTGKSNRVYENRLKGQLMKITSTKHNWCRYVSHICNNARGDTKFIIQIQKIKPDGGGFIIYGWILSGSNLRFMKINNENHFRPYPFWGLINSDSYNQYEFIPHVLNE
jgi:hypothetical protein